MDELTRLALEAGRGDRMALHAFVRRAQADVWRLCAHLVDRQHAEDLTQDTFVRAISAIDRFRAEASARTWLLSIARRTCIDYLRRRGRRQRLVDRLGRESRVGSVGSGASGGPTGSGSDVAPDPTGIVALDALLARLDDDRRAAFILTQLLGLGYAEAAEVCGCPIGTIRSRVSRARSDLVAALSEDDDDDEAESGG